MRRKLLEILAGALLGFCIALLGRTLDWSQELSLALVIVACLLPATISLLAVPSAEARTRRQMLAFLQRILDIIPEGVYIKDAHSRYLMVNRVFAQRHGQRQVDVPGMGPEEFFASEDYGHMVRDEDQRILQGLRVMKEEHATNPATGEERFQLVAKEACLDAFGQQVIIGSNYDITRWRIAENALQAALERETEQRQRTQDFMQRFIDVMPEPIYIKDAQAHFLMVNEAFARERQRPASELIGMTSFDLAPNDDVARIVAEEDSEILRTGKSIFKEYLAHTPDTGEERFRHVHKRYCVDADGKPIIVGAHFDITSLRLAERTLQAALEREVELRLRVQNYMQRLIDVIPQPVYVKDANSRYVVVNQAFAAERHMRAEEIIGLGPEGLGASEELRREVIEEDLRALAGNIINKEECRAHPLTGEMRYRIISKGTCLDAEGRPVIVGANFDITAWREAERAAEQASAAKSLFLASMSHEIRTPLSGVIGTLRLALQDDQLGRDTRDYLDTSLSSAESLLVIISDILDFSKIEAGQLKLEHIDFNVREHARDCVQIFRAHAASRSVQFNLDIAPGVPEYLRGDPTRIRQVLSNLVGNAVKFTERGAVRVSLHSPGQQDGKHHLVIEVQDTGIGIPQEALPLLFQKFQQADVSTTRRYGGTGLGLAICRQLTDAMGGTISVESREGHGSHFRVELWLEPGLAEPARQNAPLTPHSRRLRVLCAEDVPVNQLIIRTQLGHLGHDVTMVEDGRAAVEALAREDFDLVLMDGRMPEMDGADATRAIRTGGLPGLPVRNPAIRIIALTANASEEDRQQYLESGMDDFLTKPVSERQLHAIISHTIEQLDTAAGRATH